MTNTNKALLVLILIALLALIGYNMMGTSETPVDAAQTETLTPNAMGEMKVEDVTKAVQETTTQAVDTAKSAAESAVETTKDAMDGAAAAAQDASQTAIDAAKEGADNAASSATEGMESAVDAVKDAAETKE